MFRSCDSSASSDLEHRLLWHRHLWRKQDPYLRTLVFILGLFGVFCRQILFVHVFRPEHKTDKSGFLSTPRSEACSF